MPYDYYTCRDAQMDAWEDEIEQAIRTGPEYRFLEVRLARLVDLQERTTDPSRAGRFTRAMGRTSAAMYDLMDPDGDYYANTVDALLEDPIHV